MWHNALFFLGTMLVQNTVGLTIAFLLHRRARTRRALQTLYAMPYLVSPIVIGYLWTLLLSPTFGPVNTLLTRSAWSPGRCRGSATRTPRSGWSSSSACGSGSASPSCSTEPPSAGCPRSCTEAARVDGASHGQTFRRITLPLLVPAIGTVSVLTFIFAMEAFALPYAFGGSTGNPAGSTDFISLLFYRTAFDSGSTDAIGTSSALATLLFVLIFGGAYAATAVLRRHERRITA